MRPGGLLLLALLLVPEANAREHYRWQATPSFTEQDGYEVMGMDLLLWPEKPAGDESYVPPTHFEVHVQHASPSKLASEFSGQIEAAPQVGYPIDLYVTVDLGDGKMLDDIRDMMAEVLDAFRMAPPGSTVNILTFPFQGNREGPGGDKQPLSSTVRWDPSLQSRADWEEVRDDVQYRAATADLDDALVRTLQHMDGKVVSSPERVRAIIYLSVTNPTVGRHDRVAAASHRSGGVPIFSIFRKRTPERMRTMGLGLVKKTGTTVVNIRGPYVAAGFHHAVPQQTGGWVLSGDLEAAAKQRRQYGSALNRRRAAAERTTKKRRALLTKYERQLAAKEAKIEGTAMEQTAKMEKLTSARDRLRSQIDDLRAEGVEVKPVEKEPTPFQEFLRQVFSQLSHPLHIQSLLPCARGTASGEHPTYLGLKLGSASAVSFAKPIGGCTDAHASSTLCVYPGQPFIAPPPALDELVIHAPNGEQLSSKSIDPTEAIQLSAATLEDDDAMFLLEVRGTGLCGDGELRVRLLQHNGVEGPPHVFSEAFPPSDAVSEAPSKQRFFRLFNLGEAVRHMKLSVHFQADASRSKPGNQLRLPSVLFDSRFFPGRWASEIFVLALILVLFLAASMSFSRKGGVRKSPMRPPDAESSSS